MQRNSNRMECFVLWNVVLWWLSILLNGFEWLAVLYDFFLSLFGYTGLTPLDVAGGRTSSTGTPSANAEASTLTVSRQFLYLMRFCLGFYCFYLFMNELRELKIMTHLIICALDSSWFSLLLTVMTVCGQLYDNLWELWCSFTTTEILVVKEFMVMSVLVAMEISLSLPCSQ